MIHLSPEPTPVVHPNGRVVRGKRPSKDITVLAKELCFIFNIKKNELCGPTRKRNIDYPRKIFAYACMDLLNIYLREVGCFLGGRDHSSISYARREFIDLTRIKDPEFMEYWDKYQSESTIWNAFNNTTINQEV